jgi:hypothetical protein
METQTKNGKHVQNGIAKHTINKGAQNGTAKQETTNGKAEAEKAKPIPANEEKPETKQEEPKVEPDQITETAKPTIPVLNLEGKLKVVEDLHRRSVQRLNLIGRMKQLQAFEVALAQENDELEDNPYQGCKLIIEDDKKRQFVTTTPGLIRLVAQFIFGACDEKLAEIEAAIVFPNA